MSSWHWQKTKHSNFVLSRLSENFVTKEELELETAQCCRDKLVDTNHYLMKPIIHSFSEH